MLGSEHLGRSVWEWFGHVATRLDMGFMLRYSESTLVRGSGRGAFLREGLE